MKSASIPGIIAVLGSPNSEDGELYSVARNRCARALALYRDNPGYRLLLTGGYGSHFNTSEKPHAFYLKEYLMSLGVREQDILEFAESSNTLEDASLSKPIVAKYNPPHVIVVTSDYHYERAKYVFEKEFSGLGMNLAFSICETDSRNCELDLKDLKRHEKEALAKLGASDAMGA
jgi:vancomycin permeability regulator SanA